MSIVYLNPKKTKTALITNEFAKLNKIIDGPYLKSRKTININKEFNSILKRFENIYKTPCNKNITIPAEKTTEKINKIPIKIYQQLKINNLFNNTKKEAPKGRVSI